jgi:hypothetical protein
MIDWIKFILLLIVASILHLYFSNKYKKEGFISRVQEPNSEFIISPTNCGNQLENRFYYDFNSDNLNLSNFFEISNNKAVFYPNSKKNKKNNYQVILFGKK